MTRKSIAARANPFPAFGGDGEQPDPSRNRHTMVSGDNQPFG
jgi:hypothetical protein